MIVRTIGRCDSGPGVGSVVRRTIIVSTRGKRGTSSTGDRDSASHLSIARSVVLAAATTTKELGAATLGVAVGRRRAVTLFFLVLATKAELDESGDEEEKTRNC